MPRYRLLAIDIDGTLVNSRDELTAATREALVQAGRAGIRVVLATGRRYSRALPLVAPLGLEVPLITATGALVKDPRDHRTLYRAEFEPSLLRRMMHIVEQCGFDPVLYGDTFCQGFDFYIAGWQARTPELAEYLADNAASARVVAELFERPPLEVFAGFAMGTHAQMLELERTLHRLLGDRISTHVLRSPKYAGFFCELAPAGVNKWSAVRRLAEDWNIPVEAICAVGDDINDIPMIRGAGLGIAMGNALPEVKRAADRVAPTHDQDGLVEVVRWLVEECPAKAALPWPDRPPDQHRERIW